MRSFAEPAEEVGMCNDLQTSDGGITIIGGRGAQLGGGRANRRAPRKGTLALRASAPSARDHASQESGKALARGRDFKIDLVQAAQEAGGGSSGRGVANGARSRGMAAARLRSDLERCARFTDEEAAIIAELAAMASGVGGRLAI